MTLLAAQCLCCVHYAEVNLNGFSQIKKFVSNWNWKSATLTELFYSSEVPRKSFAQLNSIWAFDMMMVNGLQKDGHAYVSQLSFPAFCHAKS